MQMKVLAELVMMLVLLRAVSLPSDRIVVHDFFTPTLEIQHLKSKSAIYGYPLSEDMCNIECPCQALF